MLRLLLQNSSVRSIRCFPQPEFERNGLIENKIFIEKKSHESDTRKSDGFKRFLLTPLDQYFAKNVLIKFNV